MAKTKKTSNLGNNGANSTQVTVERRKGEDRRKKQMPVATERRKTQRRRQIDPTTCERDYTNDEIEFMQALDDYKRKSGRMFPTCSEILEVIKSLGYERVSALPEEKPTEERPEIESLRKPQEELAAASFDGFGEDAESGE